MGFSTTHVATYIHASMLLCAICAPMCDLTQQNNLTQIISTRLAKGYGMNEWHDDMKKCLMGAGGANKNMVFLFPDTQIANEIFLEEVRTLPVICVMVLAWRVLSYVIVLLRRTYEGFSSYTVVGWEKLLSRRTGG